MKNNRQIAHCGKFLLLLLALVCNCLATGYAYTVSTAPTKATANTAEQGTNDDEQHPEEEATYVQAYEALVPILKGPVTPVLCCIQEIALVVSYDYPLLTVHTPTSTVYHKVLFRRIISPNAP